MTNQAEFAMVLEADDSLESVLDWIRNNLEPQEIFSKDILKEWADSESPGDIFSEWELEDWAIDHGFTRE